MIMGKCSNRIFNKIKINRQIKMKMMKVKLQMKMEILNKIMNNMNKMKINNMMAICKMDNNNKMITQAKK